MTTEKGAWETETGLPHDVDAWIANPKFGYKDEYAQAVQATGAEGGLMFMFDLVAQDGELVGSQGYSVGTGWIPSEDGAEITHPKRKNVVGNSMYGQLQNRTVKDMGVDMPARGLPTQAKSWDGLGFHWMLEDHLTVKGDKKQGLMPVEFLEEKGVKVKAKTAAPVSKVEIDLASLAQSIDDVKEFQKAALRIQGVTSNDELMASVLDESGDGFWASHR